jgi:hypothetical protein
MGGIEAESQSRPSSCAGPLRANKLLAKEYIHKSAWLDVSRGGKLLDQMICRIL